MHKIKAVSVVAVGAALLSGCFTMTPEEQCAAYNKEYERMAALPPAVPVASPNQSIAAVARLSSDAFNEVQGLMKAYVAATETCYDYNGFLNEVRYCVEKEGLSEQDAVKKVVDAVIASDATKAESDKVLPKIKKGQAAAMALDPKKQLVQLAAIGLRNADVVARTKDLPKAFEKEDMMGKVKRGAECSAIIKQTAETAECLAFLTDQYTRVCAVENYTF